MTLSNGEKLILLMLCEIYEKLKVDGEIEPEFIKSAIFSDNLWGIGWKYHGIPFENLETPEIVSEVADILDMWHIIEFSYDKLSDLDKQKVKDKAEPFGDNPKFRGFDGNHEASYLNVSHFLIEELNRFQEFKGRNLNSHAPSIGAYKRMLRAYQSREINWMGNPLSTEEIIEILKEQIHPDNR